MPQTLRLLLLLALTALALANGNSHPHSLCIIVDDLGHRISPDLDEKLRALPLEICFAILPKRAHSSRVADDCRVMKREFLLHLPWVPEEPCSSASPDALPVHSSPALLHNELESWARDLAGFTAANNHQGSLASRDTCFLRTFAEAWRPYDRLFIDSRTSSQSMVASVLSTAGCPVVENNLFLDHEDSEPAIRECLQDLEELLVSRNQVVAICHPRERTLRLLTEWLANLPTGVRLIPVSALNENAGPIRTGE